jgi:SAM-dependent methyltransferase
MDWAGEMGRSWAERVEAMERQLAPVAEIGIAALDPRPGERIIDLACGGGATTRAIAEAVGAGGHALGVDISPDLVPVARQKGAGLGQMEIVLADAAAYDFGGAPYDALFSRFGTMFFPDPPAALGHLRRALKPGGRAVFVVYTPPAENPWAAVPAAAATELLGPAAPQPPGTPGPFGWAETSVFEPILAAAGWRDVAWSEHDLELEIGAGDHPDPVERALALVTRLGTVARRLKDAPEGSEERLRPILARHLGAHVRDGWVRLGARIRVIRARA